MLYFRTFLLGFLGPLFPVLLGNGTTFPKGKCMHYIKGYLFGEEKMSGGRTDAKIDFSLQIFLFTFLGKKWIDLERNTYLTDCRLAQKARGPEIWCG